MTNEYDPYREALVMEATTAWPEEYDDWDPAQRRRIEIALHSQPQTASELIYVRQHSGFCRQITVTDADIERLA